MHVLVIGYGGVTPALRELFLTCAQGGFKDMEVLLEAPGHAGILTELARDYDIGLTLAHSIDDIKSLAISTSVVSTPLDIRNLLQEIPYPEKEFELVCKELSTGKIRKERCYPKVPPKNLREKRYMR